MNNFVCKCNRVLLQEEFITPYQLWENLNKMPKGSKYSLQVTCPDCHAMVTIGEWDGMKEHGGSILMEGK